jgi:hypothetical protein
MGVDFNVLNNEAMTIIKSNSNGKQRLASYSFA